MHTIRVGVPQPYVLHQPIGREDDIWSGRLTVVNNPPIYPLRDDARYLDGGPRFFGGLPDIPPFVSICVAVDIIQLF